MSRNEICYRCKWLCDGSDSIDDMILCYENAIRHLRRLKDDGYELRESMADDYGFLVKTKKKTKKTTTTTKAKKEEAKPSGKASVAEGSSKKRARK